MWMHSQCSLFHFIIKFNNDQHNKWNNIVISTKEYNKVVKLAFTYFYFGVAFVAYWVGFCRGGFCRASHIYDSFPLKAMYSKL